MTKLFIKPRHLNRDEFLTPFDKIFDNLMEQTFPTFKDEVGVSFNQGAYPKVNIYEYDDTIGIVAEIAGLDKKNVSVEVEEGVLTISGDKHGFDTRGGKCITRELKQSAFKRSFNLGEHLDGEDVSAKFKDGMLEVLIPKKEPETPKVNVVKYLND